MSLLNHFEVGSACKEFERKGFFERSVFFCKHCSSSISHNNKSFSNLTTHHKVNKYENCFTTYFLAFKKLCTEFARNIPLITKFTALKWLCIEFS